MGLIASTERLAAAQKAWADAAENVSSALEHINQFIGQMEQSARAAAQAMANIAARAAAQASGPTAANPIMNYDGLKAPLTPEQVANLQSATPSVPPQVQRLIDKFVETTGINFANAIAPLSKSALDQLDQIVERTKDIKDQEQLLFAYRRLLEHAAKSTADQGTAQSLQDSALFKDMVSRLGALSTSKRETTQTQLRNDALALSQPQQYRIELVIGNQKLTVFTDRDPESFLSALPR